MKSYVFLISILLYACGFGGHPSNQLPTSQVKGIGNLAGTSVYLLEYDKDGDEYIYRECESFKVITKDSECSSERIVKKWTSREMLDMLDLIFSRGYLAFPEEQREPFAMAGDMFVTGRYQQVEGRLSELAEQKSKLEEFLAFYEGRSDTTSTKEVLAGINAEIEQLKGEVAPLKSHLKTLSDVKNGFLEKIAEEKVIYTFDLNQSNLGALQFSVFKRLVETSKPNMATYIPGGSDNSFILMHDSRNNLYIVAVGVTKSYSQGYTYKVSARQVLPEELGNTQNDTWRMETLYERQASSSVMDEIEIAVAEGGGLRISMGKQVKYWRTLPQSNGVAVTSLNADSKFAKATLKPSGSYYGSREGEKIFGSTHYKIDVLSNKRARIIASDVLTVSKNDIDNAKYVSSEPLNATQYLSSLIDSDRDGVVDEIDECPNSSPKDFVALTGRRVGCNNDDDDGDGIYNDEDACSDTPAGAAVWKTGKFIGCADGQQRDVDRK